MRRKMIAYLALVVLCWPVTGLYAATTAKLVLGTQATLLNTELDSITNNSYTAIGAAYNNTQGSTGDGYVLCAFEGVFTFGGSVTVAGSGVYVWLLQALDGTNYENTPTASITLGRAPDVFLPATTGQTGTRVARRNMPCPTGLFKAVAQNAATGQTLNGSGVNFVKILPYTPQGVELFVPERWPEDPLKARLEEVVV